RLLVFFNLFILLTLIFFPSLFVLRLLITRATLALLLGLRRSRGRILLLSLFLLFLFGRFRPLILLGRFRRQRIERRRFYQRSHRARLAFHWHIQQRTARNRTDPTGQVVHFTFAIRMQPIAEEDDEQIQIGIDPHRRACESAMAERAIAHQLAAI